MKCLLFGRFYKKNLINTKYHSVPCNVFCILAEEYSITGSEESESSSCTDWESLEGTGERSEEVGASSQQSGAASTLDSFKTKV
jgi:hypothetical protein